MNKEDKAKRILTTTGYTTELEKSIVLSCIEELQERIDKAIEYIENNTKYFDSEYVSIYGELCDIAGAGDTRTHCVIGDKQLLEILKGDNND